MGLLLCLGAFLTMPIADVPLDPAAPQLAAHHPAQAVFELDEGQPVQPVLDWLTTHPSLGNTTVTRQGSGITRVTLTPPGPVLATELTTVARQALTLPGVRFLQAPAARTWNTSTLPRVGVFLGMALLAWIRTRRGRLPVGVFTVAAAVAAVGWMLAPLPPLALMLCPLALVLGLNVRSAFLSVYGALALGGLAALTLALAGTPTLLAAAALVGTAVVAGSVDGFRRQVPSDAPPPVAAPHAPRWFMAGALVLALATQLAPAPAPVELLDPLPQTATLAAEADQRAVLGTELSALGLGTVDEQVLPDGLGTLVVPIAAPWVEPFLTDTVHALPTSAVWSGPKRPQFDIPWGGILAWCFTGILLTLGRSRTTREAAALLPVVLAPALALVWGTASATPSVVIFAAALYPSVTSLLLFQRYPEVVPGNLMVAFLPFFTVGLLSPDLWYAPAQALSGFNGFAWGGLATVVMGPLAAMTAARIRVGWPGPWATRWAPRLAWSAVVALHLDVLLLLSTGFHPPSAPQSSTSTALVDQGAEVQLGAHRRVRKHGVFVLYTEGAPYETGFAAGRLADDLRVRLEEELFDSFARNVPYAGARWIITRGASLLGTGLDDALLPEHRIELRGDVDAAGERYAFGGASYTRKVYYHAIHDIGQALVDTPLLGCTGFAAGPGVTSDGHWRIARAFDFDGGVAFDRDKVIRVQRPSTGVPFLSVSFAGIVGAVSGVNQAGIAVVINASGSDDPPKVGTPMTLIVREILQHARTLDDAEAILRKRSGFVSENVLVVDADGNTGALFEVSPAQVVRVPFDGSIAMSNHFRSAPFAEHAVNLDRIAELTSVPRLARMEELLAAQTGTLDSAASASILEDRQGTGGTPLPRGHRHAVNADIATHGVVIDATARSLWVSVYPNLSGGWVSLSLEDALAGRLDPIVEQPAAPDAWRAVTTRRARELLRAARRHRGSTALALATRAHQLWPDHPEALLERGKRELTHGDPALGRALLEAARNAPVEYPRDQRSIDQLLEKR